MSSGIRNEFAMTSATPRRRVRANATPSDRRGTEPETRATARFGARGTPCCSFPHELRWSKVRGPSPRADRRRPVRQVQKHSRNRVPQSGLGHGYRKQSVREPGTES